jgi:hypothetical protein
LPEKKSLFRIALFYLFHRSHHKHQNPTNSFLSLFSRQILQQSGYDANGQPMMSENSMVEQTQMTNGAFPHAEEVYMVRNFCWERFVGNWLGTSVQYVSNFIDECLF